MSTSVFQMFPFDICRTHTEHVFLYPRPEQSFPRSTTFLPEGALGETPECPEYPEVPHRNI